MNEIIFKNLVDRYNSLAYTHEYIWGFSFKGVVYMAITDKSYMDYVCKLDRASRGAGYALRFCPTTSQKMLLMVSGSVSVLCSKEFFENEVKNSKYNKGEIFEKLVTEKFNQKWEKDNIPFTENGDITVNGVAYQIKFEKATFTNEKALANLER